jgi:hypothetical protein
MAGDIWEEVRTACAKRITDLTANDLYHLLIHRVAPTVTVPRALDVLEDDPLISSGRFPGDLLKTLLELPKSYWEENHDHWMRAHTVVRSIEDALKVIERPKAAFLSVIGVKNTG